MRLCVYGASGDRLDPRYFEAAGRLGVLVGERGHSLGVGGGAGGLMGACARGAARAGAAITGVAPRFFDEPGVIFPGCTDMLWTETMRERKAIMEEKAEAFVVLPGGIGTFEEFFETLTLKQLGRHGKPMALLNTLGYYDALDALLRQAADGGFLSKNCLMLYALCPSPEAALEHAETAPSLAGGITRLADYAQN